VQLRDQSGKVGTPRGLAVETLGEIADPLLAAGDVQQLAVELLTPMPPWPGRREGGVERRAVPVALGVGQRAVDVEDHRPQFH
jgi:hypothetical protein